MNKNEQKTNDIYMKMVDELDLKAKQTKRIPKQEMFKLASWLVNKEFSQPLKENKIKHHSFLIIPYLVDIMATRFKGKFSNPYINDRWLDQVVNNVLNIISKTDFIEQDLKMNLIKDIFFIFKNDSFNQIKNYITTINASKNEQEQFYYQKLKLLSSFNNLYQVNFWTNYYTLSEDDELIYKEFDIVLKTKKFNLSIELKNKLTVYLDDIVSFYVKCYYKLFNFNKNEIDNDMHFADKIKNESNDLFVFACRNVSKYKSLFSKQYINELVINELYKKLKYKPNIKFANNSFLLQELNKYIVFIELEKSLVFNHKLDDLELINNFLIINDKRIPFTKYYDLLQNLDDNDLSKICSIQFNNFVEEFNTKIINKLIQLKYIKFNEKMNYLIPKKITSCI